jgi:hypothetical protein
MYSWRVIFPLPAAPEVAEVARAYACALEVPHEDILQGVSVVDVVS